MITTASSVTVPMQVAQSSVQFNTNVVEMRTIPAKVQTSSVLLGTTVSETAQRISAVIGASYVMGGGIPSNYGLITWNGIVLTVS